MRESCIIEGRLPQAWRAELAGYAFGRQRIGRSAAIVLRLEAPGAPALFLKAEASGPFCEVAAETARLRWLAEHGIACPRVIAATEEGGRDWLLMTAVPGTDLASSPGLEPDGIAEIAADALRHLHRLDAALCPFDHARDLRIAEARARLEAGLVDEDDFDADHRGRSAAELFEKLKRERPAGEDLVVAHGDACLPNLLTEGSRFSGFVDCGRFGVADRHQDLALMAWSIRHNFGARWERHFLTRYGGEVDEQQLAFYRLLDEFF